MRVNVHAARENEHAGRVDHATAFDLGHDPAVRNTQILDDAVDAVRGIINLPAGYAQHAVSVGSRASVPDLPELWPSGIPEKLTTRASLIPPDGSGG